MPACAATPRVVYWRTEDWTIVQALYFSVVTLTTIGYGDLHPTSAGTEIFTIIYILTGLGVFVALLASVAISTSSRSPRARALGIVCAPVDAEVGQISKPHRLSSRGASPNHPVGAMPDSVVPPTVGGQSLGASGADSDSTLGRRVPAADCKEASHDRRR